MAIEEKVLETSDCIVQSVNGKTGDVVITKADAGLGNVPDVSTNNQFPTYTVASENAELECGERLSTAFGKLAKAVASYISHLADKVVHITNEERVKWNGTVASVDEMNSKLNLIGTIKTHTATYNVSNAVTRNLASLTLSVGVWIVNGNVVYPENAVGVRRCNIRDVANYAAAYDISISSPSGGVSYLDETKIFSITRDTTIYINAYQNSGLTLECTGVLKAVRVK